MIEVYLKNSAGQDSVATKQISVVKSLPGIDPITKKELFTWPCHGENIILLLRYAIREAKNHACMWGAGWRDNYNIYIEMIDGDQSVILHEGIRQTFFKRSGSGYINSPGEFRNLVQLNDGTFKLIDKYQTCYNFDMQNRLATIVDRNGNTTMFQYGTNGKRAKIITPSQEEILFTYESYPIGDRVKYITLPSGAEWECLYNQTTGMLEEIITPVNDSYLYQYIANGSYELLFTETKPGRTPITYTYYENIDEPRLETRAYADNTKAYSYIIDGTDQKIAVLECGIRLSQTIYKEYDGFGKPVETIDPLSNSSVIHLDSNMNMVRATDAEGAWLSYLYDTEGNITSIINPRRGYNIEYDSVYNTVEKTTDRNLHETTYDIDPTNGNVTGMHLMHNGNDLFWDITPNQYGEIEETTDPEGHTIEIDRNSQGRITEKRVLKNGIVLQRYQFSYAYLSTGYRNTYTDPNGHVWTYEYDLVKRVRFITDPEGNVTEYQYANGLLDKIIDAENREFVIKYDQYGRYEGIQYPDLSEETLYYNQFGEVQQKIDRENETTLYEWYANRRLKKITYNDQTEKTYTYYQNGTLHTVTNQNGTVTFNVNHYYDEVTSITDALGFVVGYLYDYNSNVRKITYPPLSGTEVNYVYDDLDRCERAWVTGIGNFDFGFDDLSRVISLSYPNGTQNIVEYNDLWLDRITLTDSMGLLINSYEYTWDANFVNVEQELVDTSFLKSYAYYDNNWIKDASWPGKSIHIDYDKVGNRDSVYEVTLINYVMNQMNEYDSVDGVSFTYDDKGQMTDNGEIETVYNDEGQPIVKLFSNGEEIRRKYDGLGRKITEEYVSSGGTVIDTTHYVYDGYEVLMALDGSSNIKYQFIYDIGRTPIGHIDASGDTYYYHTNGRDVTTVTDDNENIIQKIIYDPFGTILSTTSSFDAILFYVSRPYDARTGLYDMAHREYDPELGRFYSPDPIGYPDGMNNYTYAQNNPVMRADPYGLESFSWRDYQPGQSEYGGPAHQAYLLHYFIKWYTSWEMPRLADWAKAEIDQPTLPLGDDGKPELPQEPVVEKPDEDQGEEENPTGKPMQNEPEIHDDHEHGGKKPHEHWYEEHANPNNPDQKRRIRRSGDIGDFIKKWGGYLGK